MLLDSPALTIFAATWTPQFNVMPHDLLIWANIGRYAGREGNRFWKKFADGNQAYRSQALFVWHAASLPEDAVHSQTKPLLRITGGIHIYGGEFFDESRSHWNPETLEEEPSDGAEIRGIFRREKERPGLGSDS